MNSRSVRLVEHSPTHAEVCIDDTRLRFDFTLSETSLQPLFTDAWGMMLWPASVELSCFLKDNIPLSGKSVLELGAGMGLCGMVAALGGASKSVVTERQPELAHLLSSVHANSGALGGEGVVVEELDWSNCADADRVAQAHGPLDIVLAADCISTDVYGAESRKALLRCLERLASGKTEVFLCSTKRAGDGLKEFVELVEEGGVFGGASVVCSGTHAEGEFVIYKLGKVVEQRSGAEGG